MPRYARGTRDSASLEHEQRCVFARDDRSLRHTQLGISKQPQSFIPTPMRRLKHWRIRCRMPNSSSSKVDFGPQKMSVNKGKKIRVSVYLQKYHHNLDTHHDGRKLHDIFRIASRVRNEWFCLRFVHVHVVHCCSFFLKCSLFPEGAATVRERAVYKVRRRC